MGKLGKASITGVGAGLLAGILLLGACGPEPSTPTPVQAPSVTAVRNAGLEVDATEPVFRGTPTIVLTPAETVEAEVTATTVATGSGELVADLGFKPNPHGFSFENWAGKKRNGKPVRELDINDVVRMFGEVDVCISVTNGVCTPKPEAVAWLEEMTEEPPGGHCEGMAVSSLLLYEGVESPGAYGDGAKSTYDLKFVEKPKKLITYYYYLQMIDPVMTEYYNAQLVPPSAVLDKVIASIQDGPADPVNLGFYERPDENGNMSGHAISPYAVKDMGNGVFHVMVYDNNWPDRDDIYMVIDREKETWRYDLAAENPDTGKSVWEGDAETQSLAALPVSWRTGTLVCPWCEIPSEPTGSNDSVFSSALNSLAPGFSFANLGGVSAAPSTSGRSKDMQILLNGDGRLLIQNSKGQRLGYDGNKLLKEIPGARVVIPRTGTDTPVQPIYYVPKGEDYSITLDGKALGAGATGNSSVSLFGQGMAISVKDIALGAGEQHKVTLSADAQQLGFTAGNSNAKPTFRIASTFKAGTGALTGGVASYQFQVSNINLSQGQQVALTLNKSAAELGIKSTGGSGRASQYDVEVVRADKTSTNAFQQRGVSLGTNDTHKLQFGNWRNQDVKITIDRGSTGNVDATQVVPTTTPPTPEPTVQP